MSPRAKWSDNPITRPPAPGSVPAPTGDTPVARGDRPAAPRAAAATASDTPAARADRPAAPGSTLIASADESLLDIIDNLLGRGVLLHGEVVLGLADVDLIYVRLSVLLCSADRVLPPR